MSKIKKMGALLLILTVALTMSACDSSNGNDITNGDENYVWNTFNNEYFTFEYPGPWEEENDGYIVAVADSLEQGEASQVFIAYDISTEINDHEEQSFWEEAANTGEIPIGFEEEFVSSFAFAYGGEIEFSELRVDTFNNHIAIKGEGKTIDEEELRINLILFYYENEKSILISYMAPSKDYSKEIRDIIYNSFKVNIDIDDNDLLSSYNNTPYYTISYPSNWEVLDNEAPGTVIFIKEEAEFNPNVNIIVEENSNMTAEENKNASLDYYQSWENFNLLKDSQTYVDGNIAYEIIFYHTEIGYPLTQNQVFVMDISDLYVLTYTNLEDNFNNYKNTFNIMLDSLSF